MDRFLTMDEAGSLLGVSRWTVFRLAKQRKLVAVTVSTRARRISESSVRIYMNRLVEESSR